MSEKVTMIERQREYENKIKKQQQQRCCCYWNQCLSALYDEEKNIDELEGGGKVKQR